MDAIVFLGTDRGLHALAADGPPRLCGPADTSIRAMAIDCYAPKRLRAGGRKRPCLIESADGGRTWSELPAPGGREVWSLLLHGGVGIVGTGPPAIYRDGREFALPGSERWSFFPPDPPHVLTIVVWEKLIVAGIEMGGLVRSRDGGGTWEVIGREVNEDVHRLHLDHADPDHLWVGAQDGLYETRDGGDSWNKVPGTDGLYVHGIAVHRKEPRTMWLQARGGPILRGPSWERIRGVPQPDYGVDAFDLDPNDPATLYYGAGDTLFRSRDAGRSWEIRARGLPNIRRVRCFLTG